MTDIPLNSGELIHLGALDVPVVSPSQEELVAQIPKGMPVRFECDVATGMVRYVALTPTELEQRATDEAAAALQEAEQAKQDTDRQALVDKLTAGSATDVEQQQALAALLGGSK